MVTVELYRLTNTQTITNPEFLLSQELHMNITPIVSNLLTKSGNYQCEIEYRIMIAYDFIEDVFSVLNFHYLVRGTYVNEKKLEEKILKEMDHIVRDAIDYHCLMINLDPEKICNENNYDLKIS